MPRGKSNNNGNKSGNFGVEFLNVPLAPDEKQALAEMEYDASDIEDWLVTMVEAGAKVSLTFSDRSDSYIATATHTEPGEGNRRVAYSGFGGSVGQSVQVLAFKWGKLTDAGGWDIHALSDEWGKIG